MHNTNRNTKHSVKSCPKVAIAIVPHTRQNMVVLIYVCINGRGHDLHLGEGIRYRVYSQLSSQDGDE